MFSTTFWFFMLGFSRSPWISCFTLFNHLKTPWVLIWLDKNIESCTNFHRVFHKLPQNLDPRYAIPHRLTLKLTIAILSLSRILFHKPVFHKKIVTSNIDSFTNFHRLFHQLSSILDHQTPHLWYDQPFQHRFINPQSLAFSSIYP